MWGEQWTDSDLAVNRVISEVSSGGKTAKLGDKKENLCQPAQPAPRVGVFGGWEISDLHPCLWQPVPVTRVGWPTHEDP